jgi:colanic acid/amylovoran biosynthesis glycosyltransferase
MSSPSPAARPRLAYLVSQYPAINHTFILREIRRLRRTGFDIVVASIRPADRPPAAMTEEERDEWSQTSVIKPAGAAGLLKALFIHLRIALTRPAGYARGLAAALRAGRSDLASLAAHLFYFAEAVLLGDLLSRRAISHVHSHFSSTVAWLAAQTFPLSYSITIHGPDEFNDVIRFQMAHKVAGARLISAISDYARSQVMRASDPAHWHKLAVVPLGVDPALFAPRPVRTDPSPFEVITVARLAPVKGHVILVDAIGQLRERGVNVRLRIVGDGEMRPRLEDEVRRRGLGQAVVFEGWVNQDRIRALYAQADAFALGSFAEGVPVVLMEAMAMEIPCVATNIMGVPELIENEATGLLVPASNASRLANALARLIDDPALARRLGQAGRLRVIENYHLEHNADRLGELLAPLAAQTN